MTNPNKEFPVFEGLLKYFPNALRYVSHISLVSNNQHHPDEPLHWDKDKSTDEPDALLGHLIEVAKGEEFDEGLLHRGKIAWRALAFLERYLIEDKKQISNEMTYIEKRLEEFDTLTCEGGNLWNGWKWFSDEEVDIIKNFVAESMQQAEQHGYKKRVQAVELPEYNHSYCPIKETYIGYQSAEIDFQNVKELLFSSIQDNNKIE